MLYKFHSLVFFFNSMFSKRNAKQNSSFYSIILFYDLRLYCWDSITVNNATSNDVALNHFKKFLRGRDAIFDSKYIHVRCCAHILNLIIKDGLEEQNDSITRIWNVVRYVRYSPTRLTWANFNYMLLFNPMVLMFD